MKLQDYLDDLVALDGVSGALVSLKNGLLAASSFREARDENALAAITAAVFDSIQRHFGEAGLGTVKDSIVETSSHSVQMSAMGDLVLVVIAQKRTSVREIRLRMRRIAKEIKEISKSNA